MSENIGHLYVRTDSEDDAGATGNGSPKKSTSLASLLSLRDTFKRSESRTSQTSLASTSTKSETINEESDADKRKSGKSFQSIGERKDFDAGSVSTLFYDPHDGLENQ